MICSCKWILMLGCIECNVHFMSMIYIFIEIFVCFDFDKYVLGFFKVMVYFDYVVTKEFDKADLEFKLCELVNLCVL